MRRCLSSWSQPGDRYSLACTDPQGSQVLVPSKVAQRVSGTTQPSQGVCKEKLTGVVMAICGEGIRESDGLGDTAQEFPHPHPKLPEIHSRLKVHSFTQGPHQTALLDSFHLNLFPVNGMALFIYNPI